ncbi:hypothetical protein [Polycladidibacter hongkongensis]|uniref:hypothetical protein n=1 Tax=Polycladidibacter hongkongensis TaxID=1647556 RepID=UPI00082A1CD5|nr:hypothetical protein [Pseudovibrio hongkongensis]
MDKVDSVEAPDGAPALVTKILARIKADLARWKSDFDRMREDQEFARQGATSEWVNNGCYVANLTHQHVRMKTAALYAKDPKAVARRRPRLDFAIWDESDQSLQTAMMVVQQAQQSIGMRLVEPEALLENAEVAEAQSLLADFQQGMTARRNAKKIGKTLEVLLAYFMNEQPPLGFKHAMKELVSRALINSVGYIEINFKREYENQLSLDERAPDTPERARWLYEQAQGMAEGVAGSMADTALDGSRDEAKNAELMYSAQSLADNEPIIAQEGLVFDFPASTQVIPDCECKSLSGFKGGRWLTISYSYSCEEVEKKFNVKLGSSQREHELNDNSDRGESADRADRRNVTVFKHYDKVAGLVYYVTEGHPAFLREPAAPDVYVEQFWPVFALAPNETEHEEELFPLSDVRLIRDMQHDYNQSRQGQREHRSAARPRFVASKHSGLSDEDKGALALAEPFSVTEINIGENQKIQDVFQRLPMPSVDPNLYETGQNFTDIQLVTGSQEAQFGAVAKATATESSIAEGARMAGVGLAVDDLDLFLTSVTRAAGQIMLQELSRQTVRKIAGPGAFWPELGLSEIAQEIRLEIEAGSSGKPNAAAELQNWERMLPFLIQMPGVQPHWLARETIRRLDDKLDLTEAIADNLPSIVAQNGLTQPTPADPNDNPAAQGHQGFNNGPSAPSGPAGTLPPGGNNQV